MKGKHKIRINIYEACDRAVEVLLKTGFEFRYQSNITETRYYGWPGRIGNVRVSAHKSKHEPIGVEPTLAKLTFTDGGCETPQHIAMSEEHFIHMIYSAIGLYMVKSMEPVRSTWLGKNDTWEKAFEDECRKTDVRN